MRPNPNYFKLERKDSDLPFYNDIPISVSGKGWFIILAFSFFGFVYLSIGYLPFLPEPINRYANAILLPIFNLLGLRIVTGKYWKAILKRPRKGDWLIIPIFAFLSLIIASIMANIVALYFPTPMVDNPAAAMFEQPQNLLFYVNTMIQDAFQLFGEELLAILPFLAIFQFFYNKTSLSRKLSIVIALIASSMLFGAYHLPTYNWNWAQCFLVIGVSRMADTIPYIITRNIGVSFAAHYLYDYTLFLAPMFFN